MAGALALHGGSRVRNTPFPSWPVYGEAEEKALLEVLHSGKWGRQEGTQVTTFEQEFAAYQGAQYGVAVVNGSVGWRCWPTTQAGDRSCLYVRQHTSSRGQRRAGFVDIHPDSYCLDPDLIGCHHRPHRAIIPVHFYRAGSRHGRDRWHCRKYER